MEAILYSQNSWNMVGTFYMWRWISCCFLELWGYVCRYRSQSVDLRSYKYPSMRLCCCLCTQVHRCSCSVTFSSSDRCTLWCVLFATLSGEKDKPVLDIRGMLWIYYASQTTTVALPVFTSLSLVCFELFIFFFFSWKTLITESGISSPAWQHTVTASFTYFKGSPACFLLPLSAYCMHAYCRFPSKNSSASHFCPTIKSFTTNPSSEPLSVYLSTVSVWGRQHLHPRVNNFKRACE